MQCFAERGGGASVGGSFCFSDPTRQATSSSHSSVKKIGLNAIEKESREDKDVGCQGILMSSLTSKEMQWIVRSINLKTLGAKLFVQQIYSVLGSETLHQIPSHCTVL